MITDKSNFQSFIILIVFVSMIFPTMAFAGGTADERKTLDQPKKGQLELKACPEPRPELCTMNYLPVCAQRKDGSMKTYANDCTSCSDPEVVGYRDGECQPK